MSTGKPSSYLLAQCPRSVNRDVMAQGLYLMQESNLHQAVLIVLNVKKSLIIAFNQTGYRVFRHGKALVWSRTTIMHIVTG
ncbi:hypothetical protein BTI09_05035 [Lactobacillus delbrueckii subsp. bulgaricus]|nr:hypothetical protein [Lactobacillus delbrueckii subsp. bulgaricus]